MSHSAEATELGTELQSPVSRAQPCFPDTLLPLTPVSNLGARTWSHLFLRHQNPTWNLAQNGCSELTVEPSTEVQSQKDW